MRKDGEYSSERGAQGTPVDDLDWRQSVQGQQKSNVCGQVEDIQGIVHVGNRDGRPGEYHHKNGQRERGKMQKPGQNAGDTSSQQSSGKTREATHQRSPKVTLQY